MVQKFKNSLIITTVFSLVLLVSSCLKDPNEEYEAEEQAKIDAAVIDYGFNEEDKLESGIYLKFLENNHFTDDTTPKKGQTIIIDYTGEYTDGSIIETSVESIGKEEFPNLYFVYGPQRIRMGNISSVGFDSTIKYMSVGDSALMLIPSKYWDGSYNPVVYHIRLRKIIENDTIYERDSVFPKFLVNNGFSNDDTIFNGLFRKVIQDTTRNPFPFDINDSAVFELTARYGESYYSNGLGRIFYPLVSAPNPVKREFEGEYYFPFVPIIDTALKYMNVGDEVEIAAPSGFAYYSGGFKDPYYGLTIVPPFMPVHYRIKLLKAIAKE